jgi:hypothetical protein
MSFQDLWGVGLPVWAMVCDSPSSLHLAAQQQRTRSHDNDEFYQNPRLQNPLEVITIFEAMLFIFFTCRSIPQRGMATEKQCKFHHSFTSLPLITLNFSENENSWNKEYCQDHQINENGVSSQTSWRPISFECCSPFRCTFVCFPFVVDFL